MVHGLGGLEQGQPLVHPRLGREGAAEEIDVVADARALAAGVPSRLGNGLGEYDRSKYPRQESNL